jgi:multicomponent Na+:H+ antiporter subunit D
MVLELFHPAALVLLSALLAPVLPRRVGHALGVAVSLAVVVLVSAIERGAYLQTTLFGTGFVESRAIGFDIVLYNVDQFSVLMGQIFGFIAAVAVAYSYYSDADRVQTAYALSYVGVSLGTVFAGDWLTLVFFWELMAVTSTLLVWHYGGAAVRAGFRYAVVHGIGGSLLLAAIVWYFTDPAVGTLVFADQAESTATGGMLAATSLVPAVLAALGIGVNVGFVGLHTWLPDTYPRPHIAASVFLCVFTTKTGVYGMYRAFPEGHAWIAYMGGAMAVFGAFAALLQSDMRRLLSYHIQSQVGYMIAGVGIVGTGKVATLATAGAFGHVFNHILYKSLLFMTVGVVIYRTGEESLKKLGGLARQMPLTAAAFGIAALSIAGFPGFNGFVSKGMIIGAANKKQLDVLWGLLLLGGVGTFLSFIKLGYYAFLHGEYGGSVRDANRGQSVAMVSVATLCVFFGTIDGSLFAALSVDIGTTGPLFELLPYENGDGYEYTTYTVGHLVEGLALAGAGVVGFVILKRPLARIGRVPDVDAVFNRVGFYGTRALVVAVTELYAAVDRSAVAVAEASMAVSRDPEAAVRAVPGGEQLLGSGEHDPHPLRATIGTSVLLVTLVVTLLLFFVMP